MEKIVFTATDDIQLEGLLYTPKQKTNRAIIAVHGMSSNCFRKRDDVIGQKANENNIAYLTFNNRGADVVRYLRKEINGYTKRFIGGMAFEDVLESYFDIVGAINAMKNLGYDEIYLQGHSLGCTKIVYTYTKLIEENNLEVLTNIRALILLSLIDIPSTISVFLKDKKEEYIKLAEEMIKNGMEMCFMPKESFIHPVSPRGFLQYTKNYQKFDFINVNKDEKLETLNNITIPLFMRWGNVNEMILQEAGQYSDLVRSIIKNEHADIGYIEGADHGYHGKEYILASQIIDFINK